MAARGPRKGRKRPRTEEPSHEQDVEDMKPWQIAALPAKERKGMRRGAWDKSEDELLTEIFTLECDSRGLDDDDKAVSSISAPTQLVHTALLGVISRSRT